ATTKSRFKPIMPSRSLHVVMLMMLMMLMIMFPHSLPFPPSSHTHRDIQVAYTWVLAWSHIRIEALMNRLGHRPIGQWAKKQGSWTN
ncbi:hypothetical protein MMC29_008015, partial [Sticta canariensis]|nr:hypothetical protein [Sticta canariensis]